MSDEPIITHILAIDPGPEQSAYVLMCGSMIIEFGVCPNDSVKDVIDGNAFDHLAIEGIASYGMAVGKEVFDTCIWIGRFIECWGGDFTLVYRPEVKLHLCKSARAKDTNIRQAIIDRYGGKEKAIGKKASPGPLYGVSSHTWSALAVACTWFDAQPVRT